MTKNEAKQAVAKGQTITHRLFTADEHVKRHSPGKLVDEAGNILNERFFWSLRDKPHFDTGWRVFYKN